MACVWLRRDLWGALDSLSKRTKLAALFLLTESSREGVVHRDDFFEEVVRDDNLTELVREGWIARRADGSIQLLAKAMEYVRYDEPEEV